LDENERVPNAVTINEEIEVSVASFDIILLDITEVLFPFK